MKVAINISDSRRRDSQVVMESRNPVSTIQRVDAERRPVRAHRCIKGTLETDFQTLLGEDEPDALSQRLIDGDPEIDFELFGKGLKKTTRIYLRLDSNAPAYGIRRKEYVYDVAGELKEERTPTDVESNINLERPLRWSGRLLPKSAAYCKFAFGNVLQLQHVNGLTYDFLYEMAKELEEKDAFLFLAAGEKGNEPLILTRNGTPYRGFLEGRTDGKRYMLLLHLTNLELKPPPPPPAPAGEEA